ncbi:MAG TPA: RelA/SpoT domain-containing protein [Solirubrobacterales bacterium]|nr:RelA/SpoT domain-containing protein [Solirubrobacterales bacterium]
MAYSKSKVDRAGKIVADGLRSIIDKQSVDDEEILAMAEAVDVIDWWRTEHSLPLSRVAANLRYYVAAEGKPIVAQRLKKAPTITSKLVREPKMRLSRMADIGGVRAVLPSQDAAFRVAKRLRKNWTITKFRDYVTEPKADGYRALHLINRNRGRLIEVQLRTPKQEFWANGVEIFSRSMAPGLKFGAGPPWLREFFQTLGEFYADQDSGSAVDEALFDRVRELSAEVDTLVRKSNEP